MAATSQVVTAEPVHILEFTDTELREILGSAVKQMVRIASEPSTEQEIATLGKVIEKCSHVSKRKKVALT